MEKEYIVAKALKQNDKVVFVASTEDKDRHGDSIKYDSWDLKNYKKSPRLLVDHWHSVEGIVGKAKAWLENKKLMIEPIFHNITELARTTKQLVDEGMLDTVSVGFIPKDDGTNELLEVSFVAIPANPNARMIKTLSLDEETKVKEFIGEPKVEKKESEPSSAELLQKVSELEGQIKELKATTSGIEATMKKSISHPAPKQELVKARHQAKITAASIGKLNSGLRELLKSYK